ncbi:MAG: hypothetical protein IMF01_09380 [Proteobacteria bacterium]|nr:hypothetical protein [Pseudomonadota bacterium]
MTQIKNKFIGNNEVDDLKLRLRNNLALRARNVGDSADIDILKISNSDILTVLREMSMGTNKITDLVDPTAPQDAATRAYVDAAVAGLSDPKDAVRVATVAALLASTYANGAAGVGATLTADANGAFPSVDGIALSLNDRILVKDQVAGLENGIYELSQLGDAGNPWILTRTEDADNNGAASGAVTQGMFVPVSEGTINGTLGFMLTTGDPIVLGTTSLSFAQFGESVIAGQGITKTGQTISVDEGAGLGFSGNLLVVNVDDADLIDGTTKIVSDKVSGRRSFREVFTLTGTDITNGYVDLAKVASRDSIVLQPDGGPKQNEALDFTVSYLGGAGGKSRVTFAGDLGSGGPSALVAGDILYVQHDSLDY